MEETKCICILYFPFDGNLCSTTHLATSWQSGRMHKIVEWGHWRLYPKRSHAQQPLGNAYAEIETRMEYSWCTFFCASGVVEQVGGREQIEISGLKELMMVGEDIGCFILVKLEKEKLHGKGYELTQI